MSLTKTPICDFGKKAENFKLKDTNNKLLTLNDIKGERGTLIMFICNHCPYVIHYHKELVKLSHDYKDHLDFVAISSNDIVNYPEDSPEKMKELAIELGFFFPYLYDETQEVAKSFKAACTPEFYLFNNEKTLEYRGRLDDSSPGNGIEPSGIDVREAIENLLNGEEVNQAQHPSMGCNIKWK